MVSLNLCADQLVLRLVPKERIASVTWLAQDPHSSTMAEEARGIPTNQGLAEEVLKFDPDLVIAGVYTTRNAVDFLKRAGRPVLDLGVPETLDQARAQIVEVATALGVPERGEAIVAEMDKRLAAIKPPAVRPKAIMLGPNGFTARRGSIFDEIITRAGLTNLAAELGVPNESQIPLETAIMAGADLLIIDAEERSGPALAKELLSHPAIRQLERRIDVVALPSRLWTCAGPQLADAVDLLRAAAEGAASPAVTH